MIGKLRGTIEEISGNSGYITLDGGISYVSYLTPFIISNLGKTLSVYTYLQVKDDDLVLYSFETKKQHQIFSKLISVNGVGPKSAFNIICRSNPEEIIQSIINKNVSFFRAMPGIGNKTSQKIILDLSSYFGTEADMMNLDLTPDDQTLIEALKSLGFKSYEINKVLGKVDKDKSLEDKISQGIKLLSNK